MTTHLRIAVADDEPDMQDYFQKILPRLGHEVVAVAATGRELVDRCLQTRPDLVITDIKMPDMDGIEAATRLYEQLPVPIILVSAYHSPELLERAAADHVMAYLIKPIKQADLEAAIAVAMRRFEQMDALRREADGLRQALEDRKLIERAKGIVMQRTGLDEAGAFRRLQKSASQNNLRLVEVARAVLIADSVLEPARSFVGSGPHVRDF